MTVDEAVGLARSWEEKGDFGHIFSAISSRMSIYFINFWLPHPPKSNLFRMYLGKQLQLQAQQKKVLHQNSEDSNNQVRSKPLCSNLNYLSLKVPFLKPVENFFQHLLIFLPLKDSPFDPHQEQKQPSDFSNHKPPPKSIKFLRISQALVDHHAVHHPKESFSLNHANQKIRLHFLSLLLLKKIRLLKRTNLVPLQQKSWPKNR